MADGYKTGGRQKGTKNKVNKNIRDLARANGEMPLDYMLRVMRDSKAPVDRRDAMARSAAEYLHPKLMRQEISGPDDGPIQVERIGGRERLARLISQGNESGESETIPGKPH